MLSALARVTCEQLALVHKDSWVRRRVRHSLKCGLTCQKVGEPGIQVFDNLHGALQEKDGVVVPVEEPLEGRPASRVLVRQKGEDGCPCVTRVPGAKVSTQPRFWSVCLSNVRTSARSGALCRCIGAFKSLTSCAEDCRLGSVPTSRCRLGCRACLGWTRKMLPRRCAGPTSAQVFNHLADALLET